MSEERDQAADEIDSRRGGRRIERRRPHLRRPAEDLRAARFFILRLLGLVYFFAFLRRAAVRAAHRRDGLLPADAFLARVAQLRRIRAPPAFWALPSLFWFGASDAALRAAAWLGVALSLAVCAGVTNAIVQIALWALYLSFVHVGQIFYGYGWEIAAARDRLPRRSSSARCATLRPFPRRRRRPSSSGSFRWLIFRVMLGAGLIKLRGDACWRDLTCLVYHYETQPIPSPLSVAPPSGAALVSRARRPRQPRRRDRRALLRLRSAARAARRRRAHRSRSKSS